MAISIRRWSGSLRAPSANSVSNGGTRLSQKNAALLLRIEEPIRQCSVRWGCGRSVSAVLGLDRCAAFIFILQHAVRYFSHCIEGFFFEIDVWLVNFRSIHSRLAKYIWMTWCLRICMWMSDSFNSKITEARARKLGRRHIYYRLFGHISYYSASKTSLEIQWC